MKDLLLSRDEAAEALSICPQTLSKLANAGEIRAIRLDEKSMRFRPKDLEAFVESKAAKLSDAVS